jgi:hypothetical protein
MVGCFKKGIFAVALITIPHHSLANAEKAHLSLIMWTAFECGIYAEMGGDKERMQFLYKHGVKAGRDFIRALRANEITPDELNKNAPIGVTMRLGGDSDDFMIGRIFEAATKDAYGNIVKKDDKGMTLEVSDWIRDDILKAAKAKTKYHTANCNLIQES